MGGEVGADFLSSEGFSSLDPTLITDPSPPRAAPPAPSFAANYACAAATDFTSSTDGPTIICPGGFDSAHAVIRGGAAPFVGGFLLAEVNFVDRAGRGSGDGNEVVSLSRPGADTVMANVSPPFAALAPPFSAANAGLSDTVATYASSFGVPHTRAQAVDGNKFAAVLLRVQVGVTAYAGPNFGGARIPNPHKS